MIIKDNDNSKDIKSFREIKSYDLIDLSNIPIYYINNTVQSFIKDHKDFLFYFPLDEGVVKTSFKEKKYNDYIYFNLEKELMEFYMYDKQEYDFFCCARLRVVNITNNKFKVLYRNSFINKNDRKGLGDALTFLKTLISFVVITKDNPSTIIRKRRNTKKNTNSNVNSNNAKSVSVVKLGEKYSYEVSASDKSLKCFKTTYQRHTEGWNVAGHYRHCKSGKVVFIKPFTKGNKDKIAPKIYTV